MEHAFQPRFEPGGIADWISAYPDPESDAPAVAAGASARHRGWLSPEEFMEIGDWKSLRSRSRRRRNDADFIESVSRVALSTPCERLRIEALTLLDGVDWPTASALLHLCHADRYPILDRRALWSLGVGDARINFAFWWSYVLECRRLADGAGLSMRLLDRALWGYSAQNERPASEAHGT
ncbi:MAG: hypothetical protein R3B68_01045 [Phycisphaerales bacterium]